MVNYATIIDSNMTYGYEVHGVHQMYGVFMYLELSLNESQGINLDENLFNGLENPCCVTNYPFPATILHKFTLDFCQNYAEIRRSVLFGLGIRESC